MPKISVRPIAAIARYRPCLSPSAVSWATRRKVMAPAVDASASPKHEREQTRAGRRSRCTVASSGLPSGLRRFDALGQGSRRRGSPCSRPAAGTTMRNSPLSSVSPVPTPSTSIVTPARCDVLTGVWIFVRRADRRCRHPCGAGSRPGRRRSCSGTRHRDRRDERKHRACTASGSPCPSRRQL